MGGPARLRTVTHAGSMGDMARILPRIAFVGRERELAQLAEAVKWAAEGRHARVVLTGPAGVGSTRLLDELVMRVAGVPGIVICRGRSHETGAVPYQALGDASFVARSRHEGAPQGGGGQRGPDLCQLVRMSPNARRPGDRRPPPTLDARRGGTACPQIALDTLGRLAGGSVILLILEDLHWSDQRRVRSSAPCWRWRGPCPFASS
jgi:hypothetical protein